MHLLVTDTSEPIVTLEHSSFKLLGLLDFIYLVSIITYLLSYLDHCVSSTLLNANLHFTKTSRLLS